MSHGRQPQTVGFFIFTTINPRILTSHYYSGNLPAKNSTKETAGPNTREERKP